MEIHDCYYLVSLDPRSYADVLEVVREDVITMTSAHNTIINDEAHDCLQSVISTFYHKVTPDIFP